MRPVVLKFAGRSTEADFSEDGALVVFDGPSVEDPDLEGRTRGALRLPHGCPPLASTVVPGDRIVVGFAPGSRETLTALRVVVDELRAAEVGSIAVVTTSPVDESARREVGGEVEWIVHQPSDRESLGYLATTKAGRRVYLNSRLTLADAVVLVSDVGFDERGRLVGPWSLLDTGLSDVDALKHDRTAADLPEPGTEEADEVAWLLGNPFQVGIAPGVGAEAGWGAEAVSKLRERMESAWKVEVEDRADLIVAGIGSADRPTTWDDLARALSAGLGLVRRGGRIVILSDLAEPLGPALGRLLAVNADAGRNPAAALKGRETDPDWSVARAIVRAAEWADLFLLSELDPELVEGLGLLPVESPRQAARLARDARSVVVLNHADRTLGVAIESGAPAR